MLESNSNVPKSIEKLMAVYEKYETKTRKKKFWTDPITSFHKDYFYTKYKTNYYRLSNLLLIISILLYALYFVGFSIEAYVLNIPGRSGELIYRIILFAIPVGLILLLIFLVAKDLNKWNWVSYAIWPSILMAALFTVITFFRTFIGQEELSFNTIYTAAGIGWAPACITFYVTYKHHKYITDYGGIHLFLGWMYRLSKNHGDFRALRTSFEKFLIDFDSWLNNTLGLIIRERWRISEGFSLNAISNEKFVDNISIVYRTEIENAASGLLVEDILKTKPFESIHESERKISKLSRINLRTLSYELALDQLPKLVDLIKKLSSKDLEVQYYSFKQKFNKYKSKFFSFFVFLVGTLFPIILPLF
ncbi:MAG: hypothetical protein HWN79_11120 [Candidatus Lokiarchaeota archaeon]|nr:hypothetical protein [Candidatus Lokiarchaeota archaeon]